MESHNADINILYVLHSYCDIYNYVFSPRKRSANKDERRNDIFTIPLTRHDPPHALRFDNILHGRN